MRALSKLVRSEAAAAQVTAAGALQLLADMLGGGDQGLTRRALITLFFLGADKPALQVCRSALACGCGLPVVAHPCCNAAAHPTWCVRMA